MSNVSRSRQSIMVVVPTLNATPHILNLTSALSIQTYLPERVLFIDSESSDGSAAMLEGIGYTVVRIPKAFFNHGGTRNLGARLAVGSDILVFLTQDAHAVDERWLEKLVGPIVSGEAVATFARQLPRPEASLLEKFSRYFNYPDTSRTRDEADITRMGIKAFFFSNVCSAVRVDTFWSVGGFPEHVIMNEDMTLAARLLRAGHRIRYVAEAEVIHSHDYTLKQQFRRNFDVGAFLADAGPELAGARVSGEGLRFVYEQVRYVLRHGRVELLPRVVAEAAAKFTGFQVGKRHRMLSLSIKKKLSMHSYHWDQQKTKEKL